MNNDHLILVENLVKQYGDFRAVDDLSFAVERGEIFGLLGPNGAGKTTTIRSMMDIIKPDGGRITILGEPPGVARERVGYLPEERGLYRGLKLTETLVYLAELKGTPKDIATERAAQWLERVELDDRADSKVEELSRGMSQKLQFAACMIHDPDLLILDEPFQGLDPVNVELLKRLIRELQAEGKTIVLSAHQMNLVEAMCDRICLIHNGTAVLYGKLATIKADYSPHAARIKATGVDLAELPDVVSIEDNGDVTIVNFAEGIDPQSLLPMLMERGASIQRFEVASVPLEEIFVDIVKPKEAMSNEQ